MRDQRGRSYREIRQITAITEKDQTKIKHGGRDQTERSDRERERSDWERDQTEIRVRDKIVRGRSDKEIRHRERDQKGKEREVGQGDQTERDIRQTDQRQRSVKKISDREIRQ